MIKLWALLVVVLFPLRAAAEVELINLDGFIAGIEKGGLEGGCVPKGPLSSFIGQLIVRYSSFADGTWKPSMQVKIPEQFAAAIGKARVQKRKEGYTIIQVPLVGTYRGLRTRQLTVHTGHENGISETRILFDASKREVEDVVGRDIVPKEHPAGFNGKIVKRGAGAELICDTST
jgi:hypothetical protein